MTTFRGQASAEQLTIAVPEIIGRNKSFLERQVDRLFARFQQTVYKRTDRLFAVLLTGEWVVGIIAAFLISPRAWVGTISAPHIHIYMAIFLGGAIVALPVWLALLWPGRIVTRHVIAVGQSMMSALLIHLSGGRLETHFHIFGSLAFLAFYYDWKVLITASIVLAIDHLVRGLYFPQSIFGTLTVEPWRWAEHTGWVVFQDIFLIWACLVNTKDMRLRARHAVEIESSRDRVEVQVKERTQELKDSEKRLAAQYRISACLNRSTSFAGAAPYVLKSICEDLVPGAAYGALWLIKAPDSPALLIDSWTDNSAQDRPEQTARTQIGKELAELVRLTGQSVKRNTSQLAATSCDNREPLVAYGCPFKSESTVVGMLEILMSESILLSDETNELIESIGQQLGQFIVRKQAERENERLARVVQHAADAIVGLDCNGFITTWNEGAERLFGWGSDEVIDRSYAILLDSKSEGQLDSLLQSVQEKGRLENIESLLIRKNGADLYVAQSWSMVVDEAGKMSAILVTGRDITEKKEAVKRVAEFYSTVSHELRTPLTSIRASLGLMEAGRGGDLSDMGARLISIARVESDRLIRLINDILDIRKIEEGKLELRLADCLVQEIVSNTVDAVKSMADISQIQISCEGDFADFIVCDKDKITQVLTNLLSNAVKFSPPGSQVLVRCQRCASSRLRLSVEDNGPGISLEDQKKLFRKFQQLDSSDTRQKGGTGLGLSISKAIVEEHSGSIGLDSTVGTGSTFWFELRLASVLNDASAKRGLNSLPDQTP